MKASISLLFILVTLELSFAKYQTVIIDGTIAKGIKAIARPDNPYQDFTKRIELSGFTPETCRETLVTLNSKTKIVISDPDSDEAKMNAQKLMVVNPRFVLGYEDRVINVEYDKLTPV